MLSKVHCKARDPDAVQEFIEELDDIEDVSFEMLAVHTLPAMRLLDSKFYTAILEAIGTENAVLLK